MTDVKIEIKINGSKFQNDRIVISSVYIFKASDGRTGTAEICLSGTIKDLVEDEKILFITVYEAVFSKIEKGKSVEISLKNEEDFFWSEVFYGYVSSIEGECVRTSSSDDAQMEVKIICCDASMKMKVNRQYRTFEKCKSLKDVMNQISKNYSSADFSSINIVGDFDTNSQLIQNGESDWDLICALGDLFGCLTYFEDDKLQIVAIDKAKGGFLYNLFLLLFMNPVLEMEDGKVDKLSLIASYNEIPKMITIMSSQATIEKGPVKGSCTLKKAVSIGDCDGNKITELPGLGSSKGIILTSCIPQSMRECESMAENVFSKVIIECYRVMAETDGFFSTRLNDRLKIKAIFKGSWLVDEIHYEYKNECFKSKIYAHATSGLF